MRRPVGEDDREDVVHDRSTLVELQRLLLPPALPPIGCTEAAAHYVSHNDEFRVGGDWYDLVDRPDAQVVAIVGDVVGHGVRQISVMGQLRAASNALARSLPEPADVLRSLDAFARDVPGAEYASCVVLMLDGTTTARLASAGHPPVLHVRAGGGVELVEAGRGPLLGVVGDRPNGRFEYRVDDVLLLYTDGLVERRGRAPEDVLLEIGELVGQHLDEPCASIASAVVDRFGDGADDDLAVLVLRPRNHRSPDYLLRPLTTPSIRFDDRSASRSDGGG
jgi:serine phosphatase RsbU (regulator of sigma subunit)